MPISLHLLERAYQLINANQIQNAELVIDAVVRVEPQNMDAWKTYLHIYQNQNDLDWLIERILKTTELTEADKTELLDFYNLLSQQQNKEKEFHTQTGAIDFLWHKKVDHPLTEKDQTIRFELLDFFDYPIKIIKKEPYRKPRQRELYNTLIVDVAKGILKAMSGNSFWKQTTKYIEKATAEASSFVNNPKDTLTNWMSSPQSKNLLGVSMLVLFVLGVRLFTLGYVLGYILLGFFVLANVWWLLNSTSPDVNQTRTYFYKDTDSLPSIKISEEDQKYNSDHDDFWNVKS